MGHVLTGTRAVPVPFTGGNEGEVAGCDLVLLVLRRDDPQTGGDEKHLFGRVGVKPVARAVPEGHLGHPKLRAFLAHAVLRIDVANEDLAGIPLPPLGPDANNAHAAMMRQTARR